MNPGQLLHVELEVFADYNTFELTDEQTGIENWDSDDFIDDWVGRLISDQVAAGPGIVGIGTARRVTVPVTIDVRLDPPAADLDGFDHVTEASITTTGTIIVSKQQYGPDEPRLRIPAGNYRVRAFTRGVETLDEYGLTGDDTYHLVLWPDAPCEPVVLKRYAGDFPSG